MPLYGSPDAVKAILQATEGDVWSATVDARIAELQTLASAIIEERTGAVFLAAPATPTPETVYVETDTPSAKLYLPKGVAVLTTLVANASWDGAAWSGGTIIPNADYRLAGFDRSGVYRTVLGVTGLWDGGYALTGTWEDQVVGVPDDITAIANLVIAELFKKEKASPAGFLGPDGAAVPIRDVFKQTEVKLVIDAHRVGPGVWF
jgi:hypothetical protein